MHGAKAVALQGQPCSRHAGGTGSASAAEAHVQPMVPIAVLRGPATVDKATAGGYIYMQPRIKGPVLRGPDTSAVSDRTPDAGAGGVQPRIPGRNLRGPAAKSEGEACMQPLIEGPALRGRVVFNPSRRIRVDESAVEFIVPPAVSDRTPDAGAGGMEPVRTQELRAGQLVLRTTEAPILAVDAQTCGRRLVNLLTVTEVYGFVQRATTEVRNHLAELQQDMTALQQELRADQQVVSGSANANGATEQLIIRATEQLMAHLAEHKRSLEGTASVSLQAMGTLPPSGWAASAALAEDQQVVSGSANADGATEQLIRATEQLMAHLAEHKRSLERIASGSLKAMGTLAQGGWAASAALAEASVLQGEGRGQPHQLPTRSEEGAAETADLPKKKKKKRRMGQRGSRSPCTPPAAYPPLPYLQRPSWWICIEGLTPMPITALREMVSRVLAPWLDTVTNMLFRREGSSVCALVEFTQRYTAVQSLLAANSHWGDAASRWHCTWLQQ